MAEGERRAYRRAAQAVTSTAAPRVVYAQWVAPALAAWIVLLAACGRIHYDRATGASDADVDANDDADASDADGMTNDRDAANDSDASVDADAGDADSAGDDADAGDTSDGSSAPPDPVTPLAPVNGFTTGSPHVPLAAAIADHPLRPTLRWTPSPAAVDYEIDIDDSCAVEGYASCTFPTAMHRTSTTTSYTPPTPLVVSMSAPVGRRYFWRVRACNAGGCSAWSTPRYIDVGRSRTDFDGDGYADVAIGAAGQGTFGQAFLYLGGPTGPNTTPDVVIDDPPAGNLPAFGTVVASAGDTNADGYADLLVTAQIADLPEINEGAAFLYFGGPSGVGPTPDVTFDDPPDEPGALFGLGADGVGDIDADGYADLVIGAPSQSRPAMSEGNAFVYFGGPSGPAATPNRTIDAPADEVGGNFGWFVGGIGDPNGDGAADFAIGAVFADGIAVDSGRAYVYFGAAGGGFSAVAARMLDEPGAQSNAWFGHSIAGADCDGDGRADLVVGALGHSEPQMQEGQAWVYRSGSDGPSSTPEIAIDNPADLANGFFGIAVARAGDVDGDGFGDVVISAERQSTPAVDEGNVFVFRGGVDCFATTPSISIDSPRNDPNGRFGHSVAGVGDVNGDGYADIAAGAHLLDGASVDQGAAFLFFGRPGGVLTTPDRTFDNPTDNASGALGGWIARN